MIQLLLSLSAYIMYIAVMVAMIVEEMKYNSVDALAVWMVISVLYLMVVIFGVGIWVFVESIMIFCGKIKRDGKGRILK